MGTGISFITEYYCCHCGLAILGGSEIDLEALHLQITDYGERRVYLGCRACGINHLLTSRVHVGKHADFDPEQYQFWVRRQHRERVITTTDRARHQERQREASLPPVAKPAPPVAPPAEFMAAWADAKHRARVELLPRERQRGYLWIWCKERARELPDVALAVLGGVLWSPYLIWKHARRHTAGWKRREEAQERLFHERRYRRCQRLLQSLQEQYEWVGERRIVSPKEDAPSVPRWRYVGADLNQPPPTPREAPVWDLEYRDLVCAVCQTTGSLASDLSRDTPCPRCHRDTLEHTEA